MDGSTGGMVDPEGETSGASQSLLHHLVLERGAARALDTNTFSGRWQTLTCVKLPGPEPSKCSWER